jgi:hypothetical protein
MGRGNNLFLRLRNHAQLCISSSQSCALHPRTTHPRATSTPVGCPSEPRNKHNSTENFAVY